MIKDVYGCELSPKEVWWF